jgi:hypothetical protein
MMRAARPAYGASSLGMGAAAALFVVVLAMLAGLTTGCGSADETGETTPPAPLFSGRTLSGQDVSLDMYRSKPLVLAFMASW